MLFTAGDSETRDPGDCEERLPNDNRRKIPFLSDTLGLEATSDSAEQFLLAGVENLESSSDPPAMLVPDSCRKICFLRDSFGVGASVVVSSLLWPNEEKRASRLSMAELNSYHAISVGVLGLCEGLRLGYGALRGVGPLFERDYGLAGYGALRGVGPGLCLRGIHLGSGVPGAR